MWPKCSHSFSKSLALKCTSLLSSWRTLIFPKWQFKCRYWVYLYHIWYTVKSRYIAVIFYQWLTKNTHRSPVMAKYTGLSWVLSLAEILPSNLLCCVQCRFMLYRVISRAIVYIIAKMVVLCCILELHWTQCSGTSYIIRHFPQLRRK